MKRHFEQLIDELDQTLIKVYGRDRDLFEKLRELQLKSGILHGKRPISPFLRPHFIEESRYSSIKRAASALSSAFESLTQVVLQERSLSSLLSLTEKELRFARLEPGYSGVAITSRLDTFLGREGLKFLEYNAENPAGIGDQPALEDLYSNIPLVEEFLRGLRHFFPKPQHKLLSTLDSTYREWGGRKSKPNIAIVDWAGVDTSPEFEILREFFESEKYPTAICDPGELEYENGSLRFGSFEIDVLYKRVIVHEFLERFDESHAIPQAMSDGAFCMVNAFRAKIPHKKSSFAILSDERFHGLFTEYQLTAIRDHIPWTRRVIESRTTIDNEVIDLIDFIRKHRDRFILKPNDDYGGKGIVIGWESNESEWDEAIQHAIEVPYVVQERVEVEKTRIPAFGDSEARIEELNVDFDPFLFNGEVEGGMVRLAPGSLVNVTQGGGETGLAVLEGF